MTKKFKPYANEADVLRIGELKIENRVDRVALTGDVVKALEEDKQLPSEVKIKKARSVRNPFA